MQQRFLQKFLEEEARTPTWLAVADASDSNSALQDHHQRLRAKRTTPPDAMSLHRLRFYHRRSIVYSGPKQTDAAGVNQHIPRQSKLKPIAPFSFDWSRSFSRSRCCTAAISVTTHVGNAGHQGYPGITIKL